MVFKNSMSIGLISFLLNISIFVFSKSILIPSTTGIASIKSVVVCSIWSALLVRSFAITSSTPLPSLTALGVSSDLIFLDISNNLSIDA